MILPKRYRFAESKRFSSIFFFFFFALINIYFNEMKIYRWIQCISYYTALFIKVWTQILCSFKPCPHRVRDLRRWESLTMVPVGNKASFCQLAILQKQFIIIMYAYTCTLGNIQTSTNFLLIVKIDWKLFLKDNTLKKINLHKNYSCKKALLLTFCLHWHSNKYIKNENYSYFLKKKISWCLVGSGK